MDKKKLYEQIMSSVAKEVKKTLNEGFKEWHAKQKSTKIDFIKFKNAIVRIYDMAAEYYGNKYIEHLQFIIYKDASSYSYYLSLINVVGHENPGLTGYKILLENLKKFIKNDQGKQFDKIQDILTNNSGVLMILREGSPLYSYVLEHTNNDKHCVQDQEYIHVSIKKEYFTQIFVYIKTPDLINNIDSIMDFFN